MSSWISFQTEKATVATHLRQNKIDGITRETFDVFVDLFPEEAAAATHLRQNKIDGIT